MAIKSRPRWATSLLATMTLAIGLVTGWQVTAAGPAKAADEVTDLVFLVDGSSSIDAADWQVQKDGLKAALADPAAFPRNGGIAIAVVQWSFVSDTERTRVEVPLTVLDSLATVNTIAGQIQAMTQMQNLTNPGDAIRSGTDLLLAGGESPADWILCMSTDGITNSGEELATAAAYATASGVDKYAVVAIEDPGVATGDELKAHYGPFVFGGGSVTVARDSAEMADIIVGGCLSGPVELRALEVNQSVQDWHHSVPLITNKPTAVRAFVQMPVGVADHLVSGRLYGRRGGVDLPGSPLLAQNVGGSIVVKQDIVARRGVLADSLNFQLPADWRSGTVELRFEAAGAPVICKEPTGPGANPANDCVVTVSFQDEVTPQVRFIGVRYTEAGTAFQPTTAQLSEQMFRFQSILPVAAINATMDTMGDYPTKPALSTVNSDLASKRTLDGASSQSRYYGVLDGYGGGLANNIPGTVSSGFLEGVGAIGSTGYSRNIGPHEIGHNLGRHHAVDPTLPPLNNGLLVGYCGEVAGPSAPGHTPFETVNGSKRPVLGSLSDGADNEVWGLDNRMLTDNTHLAVVDPRQTFELMGYCGGSAQGKWVSRFTYTGLMGSFPAAAGVSVASADFVLVSGKIDFAANTAVVAPIVTATGSIATPAPGDYRVRLLNSSGAELAGAAFTPEVMDADAAGPGKPTGPPIGLINVQLAKPASPIAAVVVLHNGQEIGRINATANAPTVQILSPAGGANLTTPTVTLQWQGSDPDQNPLKYTVLYSADNGGTWDTLAVNTPATTLTLARSELPASAAARLKVIASDGARTASATSSSFTVANNAPFAATDHSVQDRLFSSVQNIHLRGFGFDAEEGALTGASLKWTSNVDGPLGTGNELTVNALSLTAGTHQLTLTATDGTGTTATSTQTVHIYRVAPPRPGITISAGGPYTGQEGAPVTVTGTVSDPDSLGSTSQWSIAPNGDVDPGSSCTIADPAALSTTVTCTDNGTFTLTLTAHDGVSPRTISQTSTVVLGQADPVVSISAPGTGAMFAANTPVALSATFTDAGHNDTHTCTVDFGDATPIAIGQVTQAPGSGTCSATHPYTQLGPHTVVVRVTDDNGRSATASITVVIYLPGEAFAVNATGLVTIAKTPLATCPPNKSLTLATFSAGIISVNGLTASCAVDSGTGQTTASASVDQTSVLGGAITITGIQSSCVANAGGVTRTSSVGAINGIPIGQGSGSITVPLVAQVFYNESSTVNGQQIRTAIRIQTLLGQQIILGSCRLG
ncbi:hypothetical protein Rhe02_57430 [Rhizocola hellebori]|uniref:VWA domain-containing protein n=1 Tax=Rhizocola hellebori TaxID=1392758 RepID=A0A8J3VJ33_9ACTN|nr:choice-of-anchor P family protein [Rhizocola hellebori]GIH07676.1 hypothetical protein Rhe02_57430 [Rhizocola hellebori]